MPKAKIKVKVKSSFFLPLLALSVIFFGLIITLLLLQKAQIFSPSAKRGTSQYCKSSGNSAVVCNGKKVGDNIEDVCTCRYSSLGGNDCMCVKDNGTSNKSNKGSNEDNSGVATARKILTDDNQCKGCKDNQGKSKDCPVIDTKTYNSFRLCKSAIGGRNTYGPDNNNRMYTGSACNPTGEKGYYWICYCKCTSASDCSNCQD